MRRRLLAVLLGLTAALSLAIPAHADPGVVKDVFVEDFQGTTALDDPAFTDCLGYEGQIFEDRHGSYNLTIHTTGAMAGVTHVEGDITANFVISPIQGGGTIYTGTYREHSAGNFLVVNGEDIPHPAASFYLHGTGTSSDGSQIRLTIRGHFVLLAGLEPPASSLSAKCREPLC